jgi:phospholipase/lecithinase/hemolysin
MGRFFSEIHESFATYGYVSTKHCLEGQRSSIEDECDDPERTVYYMGAHPSRQTHRIMAEYVITVMRKCFVVDKCVYRAALY